MILRRCSVCSLEKRRKHLKRVNGGWFCASCISKKRKENREYLKRNVLGIRKRSELLKEWKEKMESSPPKINNSKENKQQPHYLSMQEKQFLFKKYRLLGMDYEEADKKIKRDIKYLSNFVKKLREQEKSEKEIGIRFKEAFARLISKNE